MSQNKQMKIQWLTVNGRQVPLVLPQYWDEDKQEWVVTSEYNPLPVKAELNEIEDGKLNVRDVDVKAELELIKQQQQQILQRLDSPIETELTGSNVAIIKTGGTSSGASATREQGNFHDRIEAESVVVHRDVREPVRLDFLAYTIDPRDDAKMIRTHFYLYDENGNLRWIPAIGSRLPFSSQIHSLELFRERKNALWDMINDGNREGSPATFVLRITPLVCAHGYRFEAENPTETPIFYRFQHQAIEQYLR